MIELRITQNDTESRMQGETAFGFVCKETENKDYVFTENSAGVWDKMRVCMALEALYKTLSGTPESKAIYLDGLSMFVYELQDLLDGAPGAARTKLFVDHSGEEVN